MIANLSPSCSFPGSRAPCNPVMKKLGSSNARIVYFDVIVAGHHPIGQHFRASPVYRLLVNKLAIGRAPKGPKEKSLARQDMITVEQMPFQFGHLHPTVHTHNIHTLSSAPFYFSSLCILALYLHRHINLNAFSALIGALTESHRASRGNPASPPIALKSSSCSRSPGLPEVLKTATRRAVCNIVCWQIRTKARK